MLVLILGCKGQLGLSLKDEFDNTDHNVVYLSRSDVNLGNARELKQKIEMYSPNVLINAAAYTAVDDAENCISEAFDINFRAVEVMAKACKKLNTFLIHISTDYVFDGNLAREYTEDDIPNPQTVYGKSKLSGEDAIRLSGCHSIVIRTAWVFSAYGNNFLKTMIKHISKKSLDVVSDQIGCPTYAKDLALAIVFSIENMASRKSFEIFNYAGNSSCSWAEFADQIFNEARNNFEKVPNVNKILSSNYITKAVRPKNSCLSSEKFENEFGVKPSDWKLGIKTTLKELHNKA